MQRVIPFSLLLSVLVLVTSCANEDTDGGTRDPGALPPTNTPAASAPTGPVDPALAAQGESLFTTKGCIGCHTIGGGKLTGPDLAGVTERRAFGWTIAMITNPDSMLKSDEAARAMLREYMTPMVNMGVTTGEARALYEFLRK